LKEENDFIGSIELTEVLDEDTLAKLGQLTPSQIALNLTLCAIPHFNLP